jgi:glycosyltransferase involved in cell wall biosynthesis
MDKHSEDKINITFVGRIENDKGIVEAIEAFKQLKYENIHFHVVGNGPMLCFLRKMYQGDKSITFYGYQDKKDVQNILSRTHIFCMPSVSENLPISVLEAMFMGAVPIFSRGDTVPKLFEDNIHGLTVPLNLFKDKLEPDVNSIISAYKELINNPNKLETLSKNVYKFAASAYSIEALRDKLLKLYSQ